MLKGKPFKKLSLAPTAARIISKLVLGGAFLILLAGYQPTFAFPPITQKIVFAQQPPAQSIDAKVLPFEFQLPHPGYLSTRYSSYHPGVDIASGYGMPIKPIAKGKVVDTGYSFWGLGLSVTIDHPEGYRSTYAHMGKIYVKKDQEVSENDTLGTVGLTGNTTGPHTHLELQKDGKNIDPMLVLPTIRDYPKEEDFKAISAEIAKGGKTVQNK